MLEGRYGYTHPPPRSRLSRPTAPRAILLQSMVDPLSSKLALAPFDDELFTDEDRQAVAEADEWRKDNAAIPLEGVLSDFGLTMADWQKMGKTPLAQETSKRNG